MLNYKDCDMNDFNEALRMKNEPLDSLSDQVLYILYTKFKADARQCFYAGTSYSNGLAMDSEKQSAIYKQELEHRGYEVTEMDCVKKVDSYVKLVQNEKEIMEPLEDYLDRQSYKYGFDSYDELREAGYSIDLPILYEKNGDYLSESKTREVMDYLHIKDFNDEMEK